MKLHAVLQAISQTKNRIRQSVRISRSVLTVLSCRLAAFYSFSRFLVIFVILCDMTAYCNSLVVPVTYCSNWLLDLVCLYSFLSLFLGLHFPCYLSDCDQTLS